MLSLGGRLETEPDGPQCRGGAGEEEFMRRRYATADVFTDQPLGGNPVAVVFDAEGLTPARMQALAAEFNYVETTFVLPPKDMAHTAQVRIFTPEREVPFAGHPNIGTAFLLARRLAGAGRRPPEHFDFEEAAGLVRVTLLREHDTVIGADVLAPEPLSRSAPVDPVRAAACLSLAAGEIRLDAHLPRVVSVGLPFLVFEVGSREALRRARPDRRAFQDLLPIDGAKSVYVYTRDRADDGGAKRCDLHSRMFTGRMVEDPGTGSATAAVTALLAGLRGTDLRLTVRQGEDMGRPSTIMTRAVRDDAAIRTFVGGRCAAVFEGSFDLG